MVDRRERLRALYLRARRASDASESELCDLDEPAAAKVAALLEELHLYQSELEVQNQELVEAQARAVTALGEYMAIFDGMPVAAVIVDRQMKILEANVLAVGLLELDRTPFHGRQSLLTRLDPDSRLILYASLRDFPVGQSGHVGSLSLRTAGNQRAIPVEVNFVHLGTQGSANERTLVLIVDRSAHVEFDRVRRLFQTMLDSSRATLWAVDASGRYLLANEALLAELGRSRDQVVGRTRHDWMGLEDAVQAHNADAEVFRTGCPSLVEERRISAGRTEYLAVSRFPMRDGAGRVFAVGGVTTDITELRTKELELRLAMEVMARTAEGILITDANNRIISANAAFTSMTGYTEGELIGCDPGLLSARQGPAAQSAAMWDSLNSTGAWIGELWNRRKNGEVYPQETRIIQILDDDGKVANYAALAMDISDRKAAQAQIERLAFFDTLTGAPTRRLLLDRIDQAIVEARRSGQFSLIYLDIDDFKNVNDSLGHEAGDELLVAVVDRLRGLIRKSDTIGRLAGDEFLIVLPGAGRQAAGDMAVRLIDEMRQPFQLSSEYIQTTASLGVCLYPGDGATAADLIKSADIALYESKREGRDSWRFFDEEVSAQQERRAAINRALRTALPEDQFHLRFQPQVSGAGNQLTGVEVLLRWRNGDLRDPSPSEFIPIAESNGTVLAIGEWVLERALKQVVHWRSQDRPSLLLAVNISGRHFNQPGFAERVERLLDRWDWPPCHLEMEITEHIALRQPEKCAAVMGHLHDMGVRFALDDFGTGYSSLGNLRMFPIDTVKIDRAFVAQIGRDTAGEAVVRSIVALAQSLGVRSVAEGVENWEQARFLGDLGCDALQGYLFGRPSPGEAFWELGHNIAAARGPGRE